MLWKRKIKRNTMQVILDRFNATGKSNTIYKENGLNALLSCAGSLLAQFDFRLRLSE